MATDFSNSGDDQRSAYTSLDWVRKAGKSREVRDAVERQLRRRRGRRALFVPAAAVAAVLAVGGAHVLWERAGLQPEANMAHETYEHAGRFVLADGSIMDLRQDSAVDVTWRSETRLIDLRKGQAFFQVSHNPERPFVVRARECKARAVGTAYSVALTPDGVDVLVTQGRVAVAAPRESGVTGRSDIVSAGQQARLPVGRASGAVDIRDLDANEIAKVLAWRVPRLEFDATPLRTVVQEFNRYNVSKLILQNDNLGELPVSGLLRADNFSVLLKILDTSYGIESQQNGDSLVLIRRKP